MVIDIRNFNNEHIIQSYRKTHSNIPEEPRYISSMIQTRFINGQDESICYVNLPFKVIFFNIFFRELIMNTNCDKIIENLDNSEDDYRNYIQKIVILQVIKHIFCVILIGGGKIVLH